MLLPTAVMKQPKINAAISTVLPEFQPWDLPNFDLYPYFDVRAESEQATLK